MTTTDTSDRLWHGTAQSSRDDERRRRLLDAGLELYGTTGFRGVTVQALCRHARVSTRSFYELHTDQVDVLTQLYRELNAEVLAGFGDVVVDAAIPLDATVRSLVTAALTPMLRDERKARVLEIESVGVSPELEQERRRAYRAFAAAIDDAFAVFERSGRIGAVPGGLTSLILVGGITETLVQRVQTESGQRSSIEEFIDGVTVVVLRLMGVAETGAVDE